MDSYGQYGFYNYEKTVYGFPTDNHYSLHKEASLKNLAPHAFKEKAEWKNKWTGEEKFLSLALSAYTIQ